MTRLTQREAEAIGIIEAHERKQPVQWEETMQIALMGHVFEMEHRHPELHFIHHSPNGGSRGQHRGKGGMSEAERFRAMGVRRGYPDLVCHISSRGYKGFAMELKCKSNPVSAEQWDWLCAFEDSGYFTLVVRDSWQDAWGAICWYFDIDPEEAPYGN